MHEEKNGRDETKRTKGKHQKLYLNSPADTSKQCWTLEPAADERGGNTHLFVYSLYLCSFYLRGHMWRGDTLNVPQFVFPYARNTVGQCANTLTAAETLPAEFNWVHHSSPIAWSVSLFMSHHTFDCLSVRWNFIAETDHSTRQFSCLLQYLKPFSI